MKSFRRQRYRDPRSHSYWPSAERFGGPSYASLMADGVDRMLETIDNAITYLGYPEYRHPVFPYGSLPTEYHDRYDRTFYRKMRSAAHQFLARMHADDYPVAYLPIEEIIGLCVADGADIELILLKGDAERCNLRLPRSISQLHEGCFTDFLASMYGDLDVIDALYDPDMPVWPEYKFENWFKPTFYTQK